MKKLCALVLTSLFATGAAQATPFGFAADKNGTEFISQGYMGFNYGGESGTTTWVNDSVGCCLPPMASAKRRWARFGATTGPIFT